MDKVDKLLKHFISKKVYDDRREYDIEDLMSAYRLTRKQATKLYKKLHS